MLKLFFWILLAVNAGLLAFRMGYMDSFFPPKSEPQRVISELNADKLKLIPPKPSLPSASASLTASAPPPRLDSAPPAIPKKLVACTEVGDFPNEDTNKIEERLATLKLGDRQSRRQIQDIATHIVYIPPQKSRAVADKKAKELKELGVSNFFIIQDQSKMRWGISLGIFKSEASAKKHLADLKKKGVRSARVGARSVTNRRVAFVLRDMDEKSLNSLKAIMEDFPDQEAHECGKR